jgi:hypothetical protein
MRECDFRILVVVKGCKDIRVCGRHTLVELIDNDLERNVVNVVEHIDDTIIQLDAGVERFLSNVLQHDAQGVQGNVLFQSP